ncbi:MAG: hypothetical protein ABIN89_09595 [Chitinophagaceae bacterium]
MKEFDIQGIQEKHFNNIIAKPAFNSLVLPGKPLCTEEFKDWINSRENGPSMNLKDAKAKWSKKKNQLSKLAK